MAKQTLAVTRAAVRTVLRHILGDASLEADLLLVAIVVVQRHKPVTRLHVASHLTVYGRLLFQNGFEARLVSIFEFQIQEATHVRRRRAHHARIKTAQHLLEVVLGVRGQRIATRVHADRGAARNVVLELDVGRLRLVELHVPVAVRCDLLGQLLAERDLREGGAVRRETARRERATACVGGMGVVVKHAQRDREKRDGVVQ